jgi:ATP-dependent helicase/nuclease subunit A
VFAAARDFVVDALGGDVLACDHTRRNHPAVLAVVNAVFARARDDGDYEGFREHTTHADGDPAAVALHRLERVARDDAVPADRGAAPRAEAAAWRASLHVPRRDAEEHRREREARQVALAVQALVAGGVAPGEIQVLARKRDALRRTAAALQALHVPFATPEESALADQPEARDLVAVLDVLASPGHDLSLAHALKSPLFDAGDDELALVAQAARDAAPCTWWDALMALPAPPVALCRARTLLAAWADAAAVLPPHDLLERIVSDGQLWPRLAARVGAERWPAARQAVRALLALSLELDGGRYATPYRFVRALRRRALKVAAEAQPDAVQLLTVHGAKGLEARVVVLVDGDPEAQRTPTATLLVDWPVDAAHPRRVAFVASEARCPPSLRDLLAAEQAQRAREELNTLYVALTRAKERLIVSATEPHRGTPRSWWQRLHELAQPLALAPAAAPAAASAHTTVVTQRPAPVLAAAPEPAPAPGDDVAARLGQAVHRLLEWATAPGAGVLDLDSAAAAAARAFALPPALARDVRERARAVLGSAQAARFFAPGLRWAGNEVPVADAGGVARIDRLVCVERDGAPEWWVLDYKLAHAPAEVDTFRAQLARYRAAVQALQPGERVRAAFVTGRGEVVEI